MLLDKVLRPHVENRNGRIVDCLLFLQPANRYWAERRGQPRQNGENHGLQR